MAVSSLDERQLVESHKAGDGSAFVEMVHAYYPELLSHAVRRLREPKSAEDAVQEALLRAFRALPRFNGEYRLGAWLHRILENVCADEGNRRRRETELFDRVSALPLGAGSEPDNEAAARMPDPTFVKALASLSPTYREALLLRYVDGLPYRDVAAATGVSEENARARVHRARRVLRRVLSGAGAFGGWIFAGARRSERALADSLDRTASRFPAAATSQLVAAGPAVSAKAAFATRLAGLVAAVALPVAGVGIGSTVDWLRGEGNDRAGAEAALAGENDIAAPTDSTIVGLDEAIDRVLALAPKPAVLPLAHTRPQSSTTRPDGDTQRWGWFAPTDDSSPGPSEPGGNDHWTLQAGVAPVKAEGSPSEFRGEGRLLAPDQLLDGSLTAIFGTQDAEHPDQPMRLTLTYVEGGGRVQPVKITFDGIVVSSDANDGRTRYAIEGSFRVAGREVGLDRGGRFRAALTPGDTDPSSLQVDISPEA